MDPFIEATGIWQSFDHALITACHDQLNERLPENYVAAMEERVVAIESRLEAPRLQLEPDIHVIHDPTARASSSTPSVVATLQPQSIPQDVEWLDEPHQLFIEIYHLPERELVTDIEVLSPTNKRGGEDRVLYLARRRSLLRRGVNLVEIDLLLAGERLTLSAPLPLGDYYAYVTKAESSRRCDVFFWSLRDKLPTLPVPLRTGDGEVGLDLAAAVERAYERGRYGQVLNYNQSPAAVPPGQREWLKGIVAARLPR
jgi:hypothetical protein